MFVAAQADIGQLVTTTTVSVVNDACQIDPRLRTRQTTAVHAANFDAITQAVQNARRLGAPVVTIGESPRFAEIVDVDVSIPSGAPFCVLNDHDVSGAADIIAVGDVHNCHRSLKDLLAEFDIGETQTGDKPLVVLVGDLIGKGGNETTDAVETLNYVMGLVRKGIAVSVRGNHELMLLRRITGQSAVPDRAAPLVKLIDNDSNRTLFVKFLASLPLAVQLAPDVMAAHAGFSPRLHRRQNSKARYRAEQICCFGAQSQDQFEGTLVIGHEPCNTPTVTTINDMTAVNLDTGCYTGRMLTAYKVGSDPHDPASFVSVACNEADKAERHLITI